MISIAALASSQPTHKASLSDVLAMFVVCFFSLLLLVYVGVGEGQRTYAGFLSAKMAAQGEIIQNAMAGHLRAGLPLRQFVGFQTLSIQIFESDDSVLMIAATDRANKAVFSNQDKNAKPDTRLASLLDPTHGDKFFANERYEVRQSDAFFTVILPLRSKFETVGSLWVVMPRKVVQDAVGVVLLPLIALVVVLSALFSWFVTSVPGGDEDKRNRRQESGLAGCFLLTSVVVLGLLVALYSEGAQSKAKALASSLGERVGALTESRISLADIDGIDKAFIDYRSYNKDIQAIGLLRNGQYIIHTDPGKLGTQWQKTPGTFEYTVDIQTDGDDNKQSIAVSLPVNVVYKAIGNSAKNFIVLFFASGFLAALVLQLANAVRRGAGLQLGHAALSESALDKCKPVLFLAVFVDNLSASFLPQLIRSYADAAHVPPLMTSVAFMAYFICFALILIPAGKLAQRYGPKPLLVGGSILIAMGLGLLVVPENFALIVLARILSGLGQGILFIGVQTLVLTAAVGSSNQNKANGIIVYNFNAGMVSGMAIGSLLVLYMGIPGVFLFGLISIVSLAVYIFTMVPVLTTAQEDRDKSQQSGLFKTLRDADFLRVILCVGIPSKAVMTGVIIFGLPIILSKMAFESDAIGQIIMFYAVGVLLANRFFTNTWGQYIRTERMLSSGMLMGSVGLLLIGIIGFVDPQWVFAHEVLVAICLVLGVLAVGLGHGAINAPVVTYVANSDISKKMGLVNTTSLYRVLERGGHVLGPIFIGQLLLLSGQNVMTVGWVGVALLVLTGIFVAGLKSGKLGTSAP